MKTPLTKIVLDLKKGTASPDLAMDAIIRWILNHPRFMPTWSEDDYADFLSDFYPRIPELVARFKYAGKPFEAYLYVTLRWQMKNYSIKKTREKIHENSMKIVQTTFETERVAEEMPSYSVCSLSAKKEKAITDLFKSNSRGIIAEISWKKRMLYICLKSAFEVNDKIVEKVAVATETDRDQLQNQIERLRRKVISRREKYASQIETRNKYFLKLLELEQRVSRSPCASERRKLRINCEKMRCQLGRCIKKLKRMPTTPTHEEIAKVMGVPKGSIDSSLFNMRRLLQEKIQEERN